MSPLGLHGIKMPLLFFSKDGRVGRRIFAKITLTMSGNCKILPSAQGPSQPSSGMRSPSSRPGSASGVCTWRGVWASVHTTEVTKGLNKGTLSAPWEEVGPAR